MTDFFAKLFMTILFTLRVFTRNLLRGNRQKNNFRILFWCLAWVSNSGFSSNKPTHYLLDHGDYKLIATQCLENIKVIAQKPLQTHNRSLQPFSQNYNLVSHVSVLMLCVLILYMSTGTYSLKSTPNVRFFRNLSWQFYLLSKFLSVERKAPKKYLIWRQKDTLNSVGVIRAYFLWKWPWASKWKIFQMFRTLLNRFESAIKH